MDKAYEALSLMEDDMKKAIDLARVLKRGIVHNNISEDHKRKLCDDIVKVLEL